MEDLEHILPDQIRRRLSGCKVLAIFFGVLGLFVVLTIVFASLLTVKHVQTKGEGGSNSLSGPSAQKSTARQLQGTCVTTSCLQAGAWMLQNMDSSVNPCDDFYEYACAGWEKRNHVPPSRSGFTVLTQLYYDNVDKLHDVIEAPIRSKKPGSTEKKLKDFFRTCLHDYGRMHEGGKVMLDIIRNNLGGWYVLDPDNWQTSQWDLNAALTAAISDYMINAFFMVDVYSDRRNYSRNVITVRNGGLGMYSRYYHNDDRSHLQEAYKNYMKTAGNLLLRDANVTLDAATREAALQQFVDDAYFQESQIAKGLVTGRGDREFSRVPCTTIGVLATNYTQINWLSIIKEYFGDDITQETEVCLRYKGYFDLLDEILTNETENKNRIMNNYLVWSFLDTYGHHLSWEYKYSVYQFTEAYYGRSIAVSPTWQHCLDTIEHRMGSALAAEFLAQHVGQGGRSEVSSMFDELKVSLDKQLNKVSWMDNITQDRAQEKLSKLKAMVGFPDSYFNESFIDKLHSQLVINKSLGYFTNLLNTNSFRKRLLRMELDAGRNFYMWQYALHGGGFGVYPRRIWGANRIMIPAGAMQFPLYNRDKPKFLGFGGLGPMVAENMYRVINENGRYVWHNGTFWIWWTTHSYAEFLKKRQCFRDYLTSLEAGPFLVDGENVTVPLGRYSSRQMMEDYVGVKLAYTTYRSYQKDKGPEATPPGIGLNADQAFFLSYAQSKCSKRRPKFAYSRVRSGFMPDDIGVNAVLGSMKEFTSAFKCPADSKMNLNEQCSNFWPVDGAK